MSREPLPDDFTDSQAVDTEFAAFQRHVAHVGYERPASPLPRIGQIVADKYRIDGLLGCGGMGAVFSATHQLTDRPFAIKWLLPRLAGHPEAVQRFRREARAAGKIMHANVIQVYDVGQEGDCHYIVMELVQGVTLANRLRERGRFEVSEACRVLIPALNGVHAAHLAGVVHRDLKPQNIMLARIQAGEEVPKVLDFGISKIVATGDETHSPATRHDAIIGTPHYMPLEQLRGAHVDARSDVYALGVIAYHMLSGVLPYSGSNPADLVCQILGRTAAPLDELVPELPAALVQVIDKAMAIEPDERFASVEELATALGQAAAGRQLEPKPLPSAPLVKRDAPRRATQQPSAAATDRADQRRSPNRLRRAIYLAAGCALPLVVHAFSSGLASKPGDVGRTLRLAQDAQARDVQAAVALPLATPTSTPPTAATPGERGLPSETSATDGWEVPVPSTTASIVRDDVRPPPRRRSELHEPRVHESAALTGTRTVAPSKRSQARKGAALDIRADDFH